MSADVTTPHLGHHTRSRATGPTPPVDPQAARLARFGPAACRRMVAAFDRRGLVGPADRWFRAALLAAGTSGPTPLTEGGRRHG